MSNMSNEFCYFAYGSNMSSARLKARCPSARALGIAKLADWELVWNKESCAFGGSAKANIVPLKGAEVFGVLYVIEDDDGSQLETLRAAEKGYIERNFCISGQADGLPFTPKFKDKEHYLTYIANGDAASGNAAGKNSRLLPFDWYQDHIIGGAQEHGLPEAYLQKLAKQEVKAFPQNDRKNISGELAIIEEEQSIIAKKGRPEKRLLYQISILPKA